MGQVVIFAGATRMKRQDVKLMAQERGREPLLVDIVGRAVVGSLLALASTATWSSRLET